MPRCYKPSLTLEGLNAKLTEFNRHSGTAANFQVDRTQLTHGVLGGAPASITLVNWQGTAVLTIHEESGGWVCTPADSPLKGYLPMMYTVATRGVDTIAQYIFQHVSNVDRDGCGDAAGGAAGGAGGGDPGAVGTSPNNAYWGTPKTTPNSAGAATPAAAAGGESPPFVFSSTPPSPPTRRNSSRKNRRKNRRKSTRRRHRTKQNRY